MDQKNTLPTKSQKASAMTTLIDKPRWSQCRVMKNLFCTSCGIFLLFTGYEGVAYLQSTINSKGGMGLASQAVIYACFCLSALFLPEITIKKLGCKLTLALSLLAYCPYIASNFYPEWETLIPTAALVGLTASLLWASNCTYLNKLSLLYDERADKEEVASTATLFFGISSTFYLMSHLSGNLISFFVLGTQEPGVLNISSTECGIQFSEKGVLAENNTNLVQLSQELRYTLISIYLGIGLLAALLVALILDPLPRNYSESKITSLAYKLTATLRMMKRKHQVLLMPMALYFGMQEGFYTGDFTRAYIGCAWGIQHIGLVSICEGFTAALFAIVSGRLRKYSGRIPLYVTAALANIVAFIQLFIWTPNPDEAYVFFIFAIVWGIFNGIYVVQVKAFYGQLFRGEEESAFANFYLWTSIGHCLSFSYSKYLSITVKLYLLILVFCFAQVGYLIVEWDVRRTAENEDNNISSEKIESKQKTENKNCKKIEENSVL